MDVLPNRHIFFFSREQILPFTGRFACIFPHGTKNPSVISHGVQKWLLFIYWTHRRIEVFFFNELKASYCSDMNVQGFELLGRKEGRANLQGVIMVRPGVEGKGESSC